MKWKLKLLLLATLSVPTFSGYPLTSFQTEVISGLTHGWLFYFFVVNSFIFILTGGRFFANAITIAALISMPVVFVGAMVSYLIFLSGLGYKAGPSAYSAHYLSLCITMLTVIPLALSMVAIVPFHELEHKLLQKQGGVSKMEKFFLMSLRVFNHIVYFVIPNILESIREERHYKKWAQRCLKTEQESLKPGKFFKMKATLAGLIKDMTQLGVEGICASIQYIPLWAVEISQLPDKRQPS
jgi:hypothetical protein